MFLTKSGLGTSIYIFSPLCWNYMLRAFRCLVLIYRVIMIEGRELKNSAQKSIIKMVAKMPVKNVNYLLLNYRLC